MNEHNLVELITDSKYGIKRGHRLLEYHRNLAASDTVNFAHRHLGDVVNLLLHLEERNPRLVKLLNRNPLNYGNVVVARTLRLLFIYGVAALVLGVLVYNIAVFVGKINRNGLAVFVALEINRAEADVSRINLSLRALEKSHNRHTRNALSAARLANNSNGRMHGNVERNAVYRLNYTLVGEEIGVKIVNLENVVCVLHFGDKFALVALSELFLLKCLHNLGVFLGYFANFLACEVMLIGFLCFFNVLHKLPPHFRVESVAQTVTDKVEAENGYDNT